MVKGCTITLNRRNQQLQPSLQRRKELGYLLNSGLARRESPSMTPTEEFRPLPLVQCSCGAPKVLSNDLCNSPPKKASFSDEMLDNSKRYGVGSPGRDGTSRHKAGQGGFQRKGRGSATRRSNRSALLLLLRPQRGYQKQGKQPRKSGPR